MYLRRRIGLVANSAALVLLLAVATPGQAAVAPVTGGMLDPQPSNPHAPAITVATTLAGITVDGWQYTDITGSTVTAGGQGTARFWAGGAPAGNPGSDPAALEGLRLDTGLANVGTVDFDLGHTINDDRFGLYMFEIVGAASPADSASVSPLDSGGNVIPGWSLAISGGSGGPHGHGDYGPALATFDMGSLSGSDIQPGGVAFKLSDFTGGSGTLSGVRGLRFTSSGGWDPVMAGTYTDRTVGYWRFEDTPGFAEDSGPNDLDLTVLASPNDATQVPAAGFPATIPLTGAANAAAASLDGNDYLRVADSADFPDESFTLEAFFQPSRLDYGSTQYIASKWISQDGRRDFALGIADSDGTLDAVANELYLLLGGANGSNQSLIPSGFVLEEDHDYYIGVSYDGANTAGDDVVFHLVDYTVGSGLLTTMANSGQDGLNHGNASFSIGAFGSGNPFQGTLDEVRLSWDVLPRSELLLAIPEPATLMLLLCAAPLLTAGRGRRR